MYVQLLAMSRKIMSGASNLFLACKQTCCKYFSGFNTILNNKVKCEDLCTLQKIVTATLKRRTFSCLRLLGQRSQKSFRKFAVLYIYLQNWHAAKWKMKNDKKSFDSKRVLLSYCQSLVVHCVLESSLLDKSRLADSHIKSPKIS